MGRDSVKLYINSNVNILIDIYKDYMNILII